MSTRYSASEIPSGSVPSCRVNNPETCEEQSLNKWGRGFFQYDYNGSTFSQNGMYQWKPQNGLRVYQQPQYLSTEYFNSGCSSLYCNNDQDVYPTGHGCTGGKPSRGDAETTETLNYYFQSTDPFQGNSVPVNAVGIKGTTQNSTAGWISVENKDGKQVPLWTLQTQVDGSCM